MIACMNCKYTKMKTHTCSCMVTDTFISTHNRIYSGSMAKIKHLHQIKHL